MQDNLEDNLIPRQEIDETVAAKDLYLWAVAHTKLCRLYAEAKKKIYAKNLKIKWNLHWLKAKYCLMGLVKDTKSEENRSFPLQEFIALTTLQKKYYLFGNLLRINRTLTHHLSWNLALLQA